MNESIYLMDTARSQSSLFINARQSEKIRNFFDWLFGYKFMEENI